jgi:hypothetical protein
MSGGELRILPGRGRLIWSIVIPWDLRGVGPRNLSQWRYPTCLPLRFEMHEGERELTMMASTRPRRCVRALRLGDHQQDSVHIAGGTEI